jgi:hypothetical protein
MIVMMGVLAFVAAGSPVAFAEPTGKCEKLGTKPGVNRGLCSKQSR